MEIETQITIGERLGYLNSQKSKHLLQHTSEVGKIINGLLRALATQK